MENITIYYKENSDACTKAMDWFEKNNITVNLKKNWYDNSPRDFSTYLLVRAGCIRYFKKTPHVLVLRTKKQMEVK